MKTPGLQILSLVAAGAVALPLTSLAQSATADKSPPKPGLASPAAMATPASDEKPVKERAQGFRGKIDTVDAEKKTITLASKKEGGGRTLLITGESKLTKATGEDATWDDLVPGEEVRGSYRKAPDGTMTIVKLSIGPKEMKADAEVEKESPKTGEADEPAKADDKSGM